MPGYPVTPNPQNMRPHIELEILDFSACLRPAFAKTFLNELLIRRNSLNLTGDTGQGKSRLLEDVKRMETSLGMPVVLLNLKDFRLDYEGFLRSMAMQLRLPSPYFQRFEDLLDALHAALHDNCMILINSLEVLNEYNSNDRRYDAHFVSSLNNLKNQSHIHLACASRIWLKKVVFQNETSILDLYQLEIRDLHDKEIEAEIRRCCPALTAMHRAALRQSVRDCAQTAQRLDFLLRKALAHYDPKKFSTQLNTWITAYEAENR